MATCFLKQEHFKEPGLNSIAYVGIWKRKRKVSEDLLVKVHQLSEAQLQNSIRHSKGRGSPGWEPSFYVLMDDSIENIFVETRNFVNLSTSADLYQAQHFSINHQEDIIYKEF
jgi:hypothetical protein